MAEQSVASKVVSIDPLADPRWDRFVEAHPFGLFCHLSGWKRVLEESFTHMKGHYLTLLNQDGSIRAAMPIFEIKSIFTGNRLVSIPFATICDPLISSREDMKALLDEAINLSKKLKCPKIEIRTLASVPHILDNRICSVVHHNCHQLSLECGPEEILRTYRRQFRQQINKSMKCGFDLQMAQDEAGLKEFYRLYVKSRKRLGLPPQPYHFFESLFREFLSSKYVTVLLVRHEGRLVAGLVMFKYKDRCSCEYIGSEEKSAHLNTRHFIFWEAIKAAYSEGYKTFDFGRTGINNENLMIYKSHWGTKAVDLPQFYFPKDLCSRLMPPDTSMSYKLIRKIGKNVPDPVFQWLGNMLYMHLG